MPHTPDNVPIIAQTQKWLSTVVIAHNLCPFAKREFERQSIHYEVVQSADAKLRLDSLLIQCEVMDKDPTVETSLLIIPTSLSDFDDYLDFLDLSNRLLADQGYSGIYQLASFHPNYRFDGAPPKDPANYTNRAPYPIIHILREASVEAALKRYPNPEAIPQRNIDVTRALGLTVMRDLLTASYNVT